MSYVITEYDKLMSQWTKLKGYYYSMLNKIENDTLGYIAADGSRVEGTVERYWGLRYGGFTPGAKEFGRTTILPAQFAGFGQVPPANLTTWRQRFTTQGNIIILQGSLAGQLTREDWYIVWVGLAFTSKANYFTELRWQIGDTQFPRLNIEEVNSYNKPAIIFENGYEIPEETFFELRGFLESLAPNEMGVNERKQRVIPLGFSCYRRKDMAIRAPGSAAL